MLPPPSSHPQNSREKKNKNKQSNKNEETNKNTNKQKNKNKSSTVALKLVTLDCSLAHVLQAPNTQPYHSWYLIGWCYMWGHQSQRPDQDWQAPLQCFSWKLASCRDVNSWRSSKLNPPTRTAVICGVATPKEILRKTKPACTNLTMLNFSCKKAYMKLCYSGNVVVLSVQLCHYMTANLLNLNLLL